MKRFLTGFGAAGVAGLLALTVTAGCDSVECGPGTVRQGDECISGTPIACGPGTRYELGRCVPEEFDAAPPADGGIGGLTCGPGTMQVGQQCLPIDDRDAGPMADMETPDAEPDADPLADARPDAEPEPDAEPMADMEAPDAELPRCPPPLSEPAAFPAGCSRALVGNEYCVTGLALDFETGCALPVGGPVGVILLDPVVIVAGGTTEEATLAVTAPGPGGVFELISPRPAQNLVLVVDDNPEGGADDWTRSVTGALAAAPAPGQIIPAIAYAHTQDLQHGWDEALGLPAGSLEANGAYVGRVVDAQGMPVSAARISVMGDGVGDLATCPDDDHCMRFFDSPGLDGFLDVGTRQTNLSGAFLIIRGGMTALQALIGVQMPNGYEAQQGGANPGSVFHGVFRPAP